MDKKIALIGLLATLSLGVVWGADSLPAAAQTVADRFEALRFIFADRPDNVFPDEVIEQMVQRLFYSETPEQLIDAINSLFILRDKYARGDTSIPGSTRMLPYLQRMKDFITSERVTKMVRESGVNLNVTNAQGQTALYLAVKDNLPLYILEILLSAGANPNIVANDGSTALLEALAHDNTQAAELLLANGAEVNVMDDVGSTPLKKAAMHANTELVHELLRRGAAVNAHDENNYTALHEAAMRGKREIVQALLDAGADRSVRAGHKQKTAAMFADDFGHPEFAVMITNYVPAGQPVPNE